MNKLLLFSVFSILTLNVMAQEKIVQTAGRDQLGTFAPKFAELNDDVLFGEVWSRTYQYGNHGQFARLSSSVGEEERHHPHGDRRDYHSYRFLCRLAESVGSVQFGKRSMV